MEKYFFWKKDSFAPPKHNIQIKSRRQSKFKAYNRRSITQQAPSPAIKSFDLARITHNTQTNNRLPSRRKSKTGSPTSKIVYFPVIKPGKASGTGIPAGNFSRRSQRFCRQSGRARFWWFSTCVGKSTATTFRIYPTFICVYKVRVGSIIISGAFCEVA